MNKIEQGSVWCSTCGILCIWSRCTVVWTFCHRILVTFPTMMHDELRLCQQDAMGDFSHWKSETETVSWCFHVRDPFGQRALAIHRGCSHIQSDSINFVEMALSQHWVYILYLRTQELWKWDVPFWEVCAMCKSWSCGRWTHHFYTLEISCALVFCCSLPWMPWMPWHLERWFT